VTTPAERTALNPTIFISSNMTLSGRGLLHRPSVSSVTVLTILFCAVAHMSKNDFDRPAFIA
jgi:hypothetical protein